MATRVAGRLDLDVAPTFDHADHADRLFAWPDEQLAALNARVASSAIAIVASPTYKRLP